MSIAIEFRKQASAGVGFAMCSMAATYAMECYA